MVTIASIRRSTFGIGCVRCGEELIAPDKSEYRAGTSSYPLVLWTLWFAPRQSYQSRHSEM